jgi:hypothetical protein
MFHDFLLKQATFLLVQWKLFNVISLERMEAENLNCVITITSGLIQ